jgi:proton-translocating NADH-quinone oxidoreductase chain N
MTIPVATWLIALPLLGSPLAYLSGRAAKSRFLARWMARIILLAAWIPWIAATQSFFQSGPITLQFQMINLRIDGMSLLLSAAVLTLSTLVAMYSGRYMAHEEGEEKYYALLLTLSGVMIGLGCATDLFNLWLWFEAMAISTYLLVAFYREQPSSLEAGIKYLVQSALGSILVLLGVALVLGITGTVDLQKIAAAAQNPAFQVPLAAAGALFLIGFGVKAALVPLHTWLPDAHSQAPSGISAMLSGVVIEAGMIAMLRILVPIMGSSHLWGPILLGIAALNILLGNLLALRQKEVKRMLAFSSLAHVGYMLLGIGAALTFSNSAAAASGAFFHLLTHMLMKGLAFLAAGALLYALILRRGHHDALQIGDLAGAAGRYPLAACSLSLAVLALGGLPPLAGFMSKWQIFVGAAQSGNPWMLALVIFAALNSVLSLAYYAPLVNIMYRREPSALVNDGAPIPAPMSSALAILAVLVIIFGVFPGLLSPLTDSAGTALLALAGR